MDGPKRERVGCPLDWKPGEVVWTPTGSYVGKVAWVGRLHLTMHPRVLLSIRPCFDAASSVDYEFPVVKHEPHAATQHARVTATVARCCRRQPAFPSSAADDSASFSAPLDITTWARGGFVSGLALIPGAILLLSR